MSLSAFRFLSGGQDVTNCYRVFSVLELPHGLIDGQEVTFVSRDSELPLPNGEYLGIHAAVCRVAHLSAASSLFDGLESDMCSNPDPTTEAPQFARALYANLDYLALNMTGTA